jgi:hypothetical protein
MNDDTLRFPGCDECASSLCDGTCKSESIATALEDEIVRGILAEQAAFAASLGPRPELDSCPCEGEGVVLLPGDSHSRSGDDGVQEVACWCGGAA